MTALPVPLHAQLSTPLLPAALPASIVSLLEHTDIAATDIDSAADLAAAAPASSSGFPAPAPGPSFRRSLLQALKARAPSQESE
jgi:hypothetical protein